MTWNSLKDSFPPRKSDAYGWETDFVLIFDGTTIFIGYATKYDQEENWRWYLQGRDAYRIENVTHWMELPKKP